MTWSCPLTLNSDRSPRQGSAEALAAAIRRGADLRIYTEFRYNEHLDPGSTISEVIREVADFRVTYLLNDHWTAGIITLRQPINVPDGFGPRASMSFFLYNQDGQQAIARPYLDGRSVDVPSAPSLPDGKNPSPKYHQQDVWDVNTNAPSSNFIYDFDVFEYKVLDELLRADMIDKPFFGESIPLPPEKADSFFVEPSCRGIFLRPGRLAASENQDCQAPQ